MSTDDIRIRWSEGERTFAPGTVVRIGRDLDAEVQPSNANVSRRHAEVRHDGGGWVVRDVGSAQGTWHEGRRVDELPVAGSLSLSLGREGSGEVVELVADAPAAPPPSPAAVPTADATEIVSAGAAAARPAGDVASAGTIVVGADRPGGRLREGEVAGATVVTGDALAVECAGRSHTFHPGADVVIGRDEGCDIVSANPTVSRRHARLTHDTTGWVLEDLGSSGGTFVDGRRVTRLPLAGSVAAWLGDEDSGERVVIVASGTRKRGVAEKVNRAAGRRSGLVLAVVGAVVVVALVVLGLLALVGGGPDDDTLARGTVRIEDGARWGSGTIIDAERGLILTNAHVAAPSAPGAAVFRNEFAEDIAENPKEVRILVNDGLAKDAEPRFVGKVVAVDGYLDLAVVQITETTGGRIVEPESGDLDDLVEIEVGDSDALESGDAIRVFGYPRAAQSASVTLTSGVVSGAVKDERLGSNRGMLNISADISGGNSGGLAVDDGGRIVGIPTIVREEKVGSMRPVAWAAPLIEAAQKGREYRSPYVRALGDAQISNATLVAPGSASGIDFSCSNRELRSITSGIGVSFDFEGFAPDEHQDLLVVVAVDGEPVGGWALNGEYPVAWPASGCATVTVPIDASAVGTGDISLGFRIGLGPHYETVS